MKTRFFHTMAWIAATLLLQAGNAGAAVVGPVGYTNDFAVQPPAADWATSTRTGAAADVYDSDTDVNANIIATAVTTQTTLDAGNPPPKIATATWSSSGFYLQTRPTGNRYTTLLGKFVNNTGTNATQVNLSYLFTITGVGVAEDAVKGTRAYYSLSGAVGAWTNLAALNTTASANGSSIVTTNVALNWTNGGNLYLLWVDDNANAQGDDSANQIDNFTLQVAAGIPLTLACRVTAPGSNAVLVSGTTLLTAAAVFAGTPPFTVEYFTNSGAGYTLFNSAGTSGTAPYNVNLGAYPSGTYNIYAVVTDSAGSPSSASSLTNTFFVADPIALQLAAPAQGATFDILTSVTGVATVTGGTAPYSVQFQLDSSASGAPVTLPPYERNFGSLFVGDHTIRATVTDSKNWVSNSLVHTIHVTGPLGVTLTPTNGFSYTYGEPVVLTAIPGGGAAPYSVTFFTNDQPVGLVSSAPFATNLGVLPPGSYASYVRITDSSSPVAQQNFSTTNAISVLPNPLTAVLTSPTNGQSATAGQPFSLTATASVSVPLAVTNVEFFFDGNSAGADATAPYSASVANPTAGTHQVYASATDSLGRKSYTATNSVIFVVDPLANNNFANRFTLPTPASVTGANAGATTEGGEPTGTGGFGGVNWGATLWWKWTAPVTGTVTIDTIGSGFNTYLAVYTGAAVNALTLVQRNDNAPGLVNVSLVTFAAQQGTEYAIQVGGVRTGGGGGAVIATGAIQLKLTMPPAVTLTSPTNGNVFFAGSNIFLSATATSIVGTITKVDFYRGASRIGTVSNSPYSAILSNAPPGSNSLYAVATDSIGQVAASSAVNVLVANPGITIVTPSDGAVFASTNPITVSVVPLVSAGAITNVEFFVNGQKFGQDATAPFSAVWTNVMGGSQRLTATALDDLGRTWVATPVNIGVARVLVASNSVWKYRDDGTDQGTNWFASNFDDSAWSSGPAPLGYGDSNGRQPGTTNSFGPSSTSKFITTYFRQAFLATNVASYTNLILNIQRDDGAIVYLNGAELSRFNMPAGAVTYTTFASANASDDGGTTFSINVNPALVHEGNNVFAVEIHQDAIDSSDIWMELDLLGVPAIIRNLSPLVVITDPTNTEFIAPPVLYLNATATDPDGTIANVAFFADGAKIGDAASSGGADSYSAAWTNPPIGAHSVTAVATDNQNATTTSTPIPVIIYDAQGAPLAQLTFPISGTTLEGPTNLLLTATAHALNGVTNVQFLANGIEIGNDATAPYTVVWHSSFLSNGLAAVVFDAFGTRGTSAVVSVNITIPPTNVLAPTVASKLPLASATITNLTSVTIVFSERVQNVDAGDLLINGIPATGVSGAGSNYVFTFPQPAYGQVEISFAGTHGITDFGFPSNLPFSEFDPTAAWDYNLIDRTPPAVASKTPGAGVTVTNLTIISVTFTEPVVGVDASDLLLNGTPAFALSGSGANYTFNVSQPPSGTVSVTWSTNHGITDLSDAPNAFNRTGSGATWVFTLDSRTVLVQSNSTWRYVKGLAEASTPADAWRQPAFDDSGWTASRTPFLYGEATFTNASNPGTDLGDMTNNAYSSIYLRKTFVVSNPSVITNLLLNHQSDDGFIAWLNGVEVMRYNMPAGPIPFDGGALTAVAESGGNSGVPYILVTLTNAPLALVAGINTFAVHAFNVVTNPASSDFVFNAQLYTFLSDASVTAPRLAQASPAPGDVFYLTNVTVTFSEGVTNVDTADLLVNGVPASSMTSTTNTAYTFDFLQPAYGAVTLTWATNHGIRDFDEPPKPFDGAASSAILHYTLVNPSAPTVAAQIPSASTTITGLTSVTVTFSEPVAGVNATDLLINGVASSGIASVTNTTYTFTFSQPAFGSVAIRWDTNHGIVDLDAPANDFDPARPGNTWNYTLVNPVPTVTLTSPTNTAYILAPANIPVRATAVDNDGTITRVEFYSGAGKIGEVTNAPYNFTWTGVEENSYTLLAVATDDSGLKGTSAPVVINVVTSLPVLLTRGPYLQMGSPTGAVVRWRTDQFSDAVVRFGTDPASLTSAALQSFATNEHIVRIDGLQPDTKYYYSIGSGAQRLAGTNGPGSDYWFRTSPVVGTKKPTRLWVLGDAGTAGNGSPTRQASTRDAYLNYAATNGAADLVMMLGDNAYNSGTDTEYQPAVFDMYPTILRNKFLWTTLGNHETSQSTTATDFPYLRIFSLPQNSEVGGVPSGTEKYYSFDYANIHIVCLDSMTSGRTGTSPMAQWLENDLAATAQEWVIVYFHHSLYTKGTHDSDSESDLVQLRQNIVPILEANGVDLVLNGHSHVYERSFLLDGHYGLSSTLTPSMKIDGGDGREDGTGAYRKNGLGRGVVYTIAGSSGQALGGPLNHPAHFISINELGSVIIDVSSNRLDALFLNSSGVSRDHYTLLKAVAGAPAVPLQLAARFTNHTAVRLTWTDAATNELAYVIERSLDGTNFTSLLTAAADSTSALDASVLAGNTYFYRVRATNAVAFSDYSEIASATAANAVPIAVADSFHRFPGQNLSIAFASLLANDTDADGDTITFEGAAATSAQGGAISVVGQSLLYVPVNGFNRSDSFFYRIADGFGGSNSALVNIFISSNTPPLLAPVSDFFAGVLTRLMLTNSATDADLPANRLTFSLDPGAPPDARIHPGRGRLFWTPSRAYANTTNRITVRATDDGLPPLSSTTSFNVIVPDYVELTAGALVMRAGDTSSVPLEVTATAGLTSLQFTVRFTDNRLTNLSLEPLSPHLTNSTLQSSGPGSALLSFGASSAQPLQGSEILGRLHFTAATGYHSAFVPLELQDPGFTRATVGFQPSALLNNGRVVVIEAEPLVEALIRTNNTRDLFLYGRFGVSYTVETSTSFNPPNWIPGSPLTMTNLYHLIPLTNPPGSLIFYRARE